MLALCCSDSSSGWQRRHTPTRHTSIPRWPMHVQIPSYHRSHRPEGKLRALRTWKVYGSRERISVETRTTFSARERGPFSGCHLAASHVQAASPRRSLISERLRQPAVAAHTMSTSTRPGGDRPCSSAVTFSRVCSAIVRIALSVEKAWWLVMMTLGNVNMRAKTSS